MSILKLTRRGIRDVSRDSLLLRAYEGAIA
jgi:hypothetical protein